MHPNLTRWRDDTPGTRNRIHLNSAGASLMPRPVSEAIIAHTGLEAAIGGYEAADERAGAISEVYEDLATLVNTRPSNIAICPSATAAFIQCISSVDFAPGDVIITSRCDYTSYQINYLSLAKRLGVKVLHAEDLPEGGIDPASVQQLLKTPRVKFVSVSWVPTNSGLVQDVASVGELCAEAGVPYHIDACQAVGQIPIDLGQLNCDYLSATGRKFLRGPRGIGFLFSSDRALKRGDYPLFIDMRGAVWSSATEYTVAESARRFEDWEFPYALVLGLGAAARYANEVGQEGGQRAFALANRLRAGLARIPGVRLLDRGTNPCAIVTAEVAGHDGAEVKRWMLEHKVNVVSTLRWFAQYDFADKKVESGVRLSPHYFNTEAEVDRGIELMREIATR